MAIFYAVLPLLLALVANSIPIPNGQIGKAEVECGEENIEIVFLTEDIFQGRVFVVGHANEEGCFSREVGRRTTSITIRKDQCGVVTTRSTNPPGLFVNIDRGYEISCFYMQSEKTVTYPLSVSPNTLVPLTEIAEMPRCRYEVVDPATPCQSLPSDPNCCTNGVVTQLRLIFGACKCTRASSKTALEPEIVILNDDGCAIDRYLLDNLEYGPGALQAQKEAHAFKFADKVVVNFQCSIRLDIRDGECPTSQARNQDLPSVHIKNCRQL
ncbi:ZP domain-containing protein [Aphelenchoides bicaudatus]|nr:ZP domain-containing protein [Aphelenchoides bicaudatus]